ncbi:MAG: ribose-phosphate pyrophosphokinase [Rhabdochlamydiaceae bacterium]|nr:ribose-phosphate pyrophosphokinase [Candidatus Amphrikana amoebophyrae]
MSSVQQFKLFTGTSHPSLASSIANELNIELSQSKSEVFPDGEIGIQILDNVRGQDVFVVQSAAGDPNHYLMELLIFVDALKRASASSITAVMPYFPYSRQDRKDKGRVPITAKLVANMLETAGVTRLLTMDLHADQIQGFFDIPVDNLYSQNAFATRLSGVEEKVIVAPDLGSVRLAKAYAHQFNCQFAIVDKKRICPTEVSARALIGDVRGKHVLIVDDMCSTGKTLIEAAQLVKELGALSVEAVVAHFLSDPRCFQGSPIEKLLITDTIHHDLGKLSPFIEIVSVAKLIGQAIRSMNESLSISNLLKP